MGRLKDLPIAWVAAAIFVLALGIRLSLIGDSFFSDDEALHWRVAREIAEGRYFPRLGPAVTIEGAHTPGPLYFYLLAISQFFTRSPLFANALVALLGSLSVVLCWDAYRRMFGIFGATVAGVLLATYPWSTLFSDRIWNPNVVPFFAALSLWCAAQLVINNRFDKSNEKFAIALVAVTAILPQIHLSTIALWPALLFLVWPSFRYWNSRVWKIALGVVFVFYLPYLTMEIKTGFANSLALLSGSVLTDYSYHFLTLPLYLVRFLSLDTLYYEMQGYWQPIKEGDAICDAFAHSNLTNRFFIWSGFLFFLGCFGRGIFLASSKHWQLSRHRFFIATLIAIFCFWGLLAISGKHLFPHYVQSIVVFAFGLFAYIAASVEHLKKAKIFLSIAALVCALGGVYLTRYITFEHNTLLGYNRQNHIVRTLIEQASKNKTPKLQLTAVYRITFFPLETLAREKYDVEIKLTRYPGDHPWLHVRKNGKIELLNPKN